MTYLIGEANPYGADPKYALYPLPERASGARLCEILGLSAKEYLRIFQRRNLCPQDWDTKTARASAQNILAEAGNGSPVIVALGAKVAKAFGLTVEQFDVEPVGCALILRLPHPSGLCRVWNEPNAVQRARQALADVSTDYATAMWGGR